VGGHSQHQRCSSNAEEEPKLHVSEANCQLPEAVVSWKRIWLAMCMPLWKALSCQRMRGVVSRAGLPCAKPLGYHWGFPLGIYFLHCLRFQFGD